MHMGERLNGVTEGRRFQPKWLLLLIPLALTLLPLALGGIIVWELVSPVDLAGFLQWLRIAPCAFLAFGRFCCLLLIGAYLALWGGALYAYHTACHTTVRTVLCAVAALLALAAVGFLILLEVDILWVAYG